MTERPWDQYSAPVGAVFDCPPPCIELYYSPRRLRNQRQPEYVLCDSRTPISSFSLSIVP
ncbi:hypothetical protein JMJ77_0009612, partial [Colletotrichum scovillei]